MPAASAAAIAGCGEFFELMMSQYPSPYSAPYQYPAGYWYDPAAALLGPAKRASVLMFVLGGMGLVCGLCLGVGAALAPVGQIIAQSGIEIPQTAELGISAEQLMRVVYAVLAGGALAVSLAMLVLGVFVRRGAKGAIVMSIVLCGLVGLFLLLNMTTSLLQLTRGQAAAAVLMSVAIAGGCLSLFVVLLVWLVQAARASGAIRTARMQYQMQYWQYQQQQQQYMQQAGYGYSAPQAPPEGGDPGARNSAQG